MLWTGMRVCPAVYALVACAFAAACSDSSSGTGALAVSRIGPEGGIVVVERGSQQGLVLEVPPGTVDQPTDFRIIEELLSLPDENQLVTVGGQAGQPFRIEPIDLVTTESMRLRVPYQPGGISGTGTGNVDVRQINPWATRDYDPEAVDPLEGWVEISIKTLGRFQVVLAMGPQDRSDYLPAFGSVAQLTGGYEFRIEPELTPSPYVGLGAEQWTIVGPDFDERLIVVDNRIVGRRREPLVWLETWTEPYDPFGDPVQALSNMVVQPAQVSAPVNQQFTGASVMPLGYFQYGLPQTYAGELLTDVGRLTLNVAYNRSDLGSGERQLTLWLSPVYGVLQLSIDGIVYDRIP